MRIEYDISVQGLEPHLISSEYIEVLEFVVLGKWSLAHESEFAPGPVVDRADDDPFRKGLHGGPVWCHYIPSMVYPIGRVLSVRTSCSGEFIILGRQCVSMDRRDVFRIFPIVENLSCDIALERDS